MSTHAANRLALWVVATIFVLLTSMLLTLAWWLAEDAPVTAGPSYAVTFSGQSVGVDRPALIKRGEPLRVRHSYCVATEKPGVLNQTLEDGVMVVLSPQPWVQRRGCREHTFVIDLPQVLELGHVYLHRASVTTRVNPVRPAETIWFQAVPFIVTEG